MSLEEFLAQPCETFHDFHELHNREVGEVPGPTVEHLEIQDRVVTLLQQRFSADRHYIRQELYITLDTESRRVDVGMLRRERLAPQRKNVFFGSPELVVEILSPSTLMMDLDHLREMCSNDHCIEFWFVNPEYQTVTAYRRGRVVSLHASGDSLPLDAFGVSDSIPVSAFFV